MTVHCKILPTYLLYISCLDLCPCTLLPDNCKDIVLQTRDRPTLHHEAEHEPPALEGHPLPLQWSNLRPSALSNYTHEGTTNYLTIHMKVQLIILLYT